MYFVDLASTAQARSKLNQYEALNAYDLPVIEVHISNVHADGVIAEFGTHRSPTPTSWRCPGQVTPDGIWPSHRGDIGSFWQHLCGLEQG
jgi:3-dehydroquinate dehydratase